MNWKLIVITIIVAYGGFNYCSTRPILHGSGVIASAQPHQDSTSQPSFTFKQYAITPLESFEIEARVLSAEHYTFGREADLAPVDLALGWGPMSDESVLSKIEISQSNRFYYWHVDAFPIARSQIENNSGNMHMIPATSTIEKSLKSIRPGQIVKLNGYLVEVKAADGWHWRSSLSRTDTGNGACELVYIKTLSVR